MSDNIKVFSASALGLGSSLSNLFDDSEPFFRVLALVGQISVALVTTIYIIAKIRAVRKSKKDDETP